MSYCLNPHCQKTADNPPGANFCQNCGTKLLLRERYRAIKLIGQGGFGRTFLAIDEDKPSKPRCVIKQFFPQAQGTNSAQKASELFEQEAIRLDELGKHSQIPELFAHFSQDSRQYIVQEFIDGENLGEELAATGAFDENKIQQVLNDLLAVLQFIHQGKVIHRDIKPENIIRRRLDGKLVLVDFGAAKYATTTALVKTGTSIGSAGYAAPEQSFGKAVFASDIYCLGVTCIYLLTNIQPYELYDPIESALLWQNQVKHKISKELITILNKMIQNAVKARYQSAEEVLQALQSLNYQKASPHTGNLKPSIQNYRLANFSSSSHPLPPPKVIIPAVASIKIEFFTNIRSIDPFYSIAFSPEKYILAAGNRNKTIKIWDLHNGKELNTLGGRFNGHAAPVFAVAFSRDRYTLASGSDDTTVKVWDIRNSQEKCTFRGHTNAVYSVAFSPDGYTLISGSYDGNIKVWNLYNRAEKFTLKGHSNPVTSVAFSPDGKIIASGSRDTTIQLWNAVTGEAIHTIESHSRWVNCIAFSQDGKFLASGSADNTIKLWDINTQQEKYTFSGHTGAISSLTFSYDGQILVSGSKDATIKFWDIATGQEINHEEGHSGEIYAVIFSQDGQIFATSSEDCIKIWKVIRN